MKSHFLRKAAWILPLVSLFFGGTVTAQPFLQAIVTNGLSEPYGVAVATNLFITDSANNRIVSYNPISGALTNLAGSPTGVSGAKDGPGVFSLFFNPQGIVYSPARGGLVVADSGNHTIRFIALGSGIVSPLAGAAGSPGNTDGAGAAARFNSPAGLAIDNAGAIYVADLLNNRIRKIDLTNNVTPVSTGGFNFNRPSAVSWNPDTGDLYVADTGTHSIRVIHTNGTVELVAGSGSAFDSGDADALVGTDARFKAPRGLLWVGGKTGLIVLDTGNHLLRRVYFNTTFNTFSVERFGRFDASLSAPVGITIDQDGNFPLVDLGNNTLSLVQVTIPQPPVSAPSIGVVNLTTNLFGQLVTALTPVVSSTFNNDIVAAILGEDGTQTFFTLDPTANFPTDPNSRSTPPTYRNGLPQFTNSFFNPAVNGSNVVARAFSTQTGRKPSPVVSAQFQFIAANPVINGINPGDFTMSVATTNADLWFTTDGSSPTNNFPSRLYQPGSHLNIVNGTTNDIPFKVRAFRQGYAPSTEVAQIFHFSDLQNSSIGVTRDFTAGIGSTIVVPVEVKLSSTNILKSLQFRIELTPLNGGPAISSQLRNLPIGTNDFISVPMPSTNPPAATLYTNGTTTGLAISFVGKESGLNVSGSAKVALVAVPIPPSAAVGQTYSLAVVQPSGTSDGFQAAVNLATFQNRQITVTNQPYIVGDSATAQWYNSGDFGSGNLANNDVNNAFHASFGSFTPYSFSDVFDAMDAFPEDSAAAVGGDGQIRFLDWQVILKRSLRLSSNNWTRTWSAGGVRVAASTVLNSGLPNTPAQIINQTGDPSVWSRQALVGANTIENVKPGTGISVPLYVKIKAGNQVAGLQFRVAVDPVGSAPPLVQPVQFVADGLLPAPIALQGAQDGLPPNQAVGAWSLVQNHFSPALQGTQPLGAIDFTVPANAQPGQSYRVHFINADGAPDIATQYDFETLPGIVWVGTSAQHPPETISDEWKIHFFGSVDNPWAKADADPDGDGVANRIEYSLGKNPVKLHLYNRGAAWQESLKAGKFDLRWFGVTGKQYQIESSSDLQSWAAAGSAISGQGDVLAVNQDAQAGQPRFYRVRVRP